MVALAARDRARWLCAVLAVATVAAASSTQATEPVPARGQPVAVYLDQARLLKLPERTATLVVGNPVIADVAVQPGGMLVITGKSYGVTNLIALDRAGNTLMEHPIQVQGPRDTVVVYRGTQRESYNCTPNCERRITLGDSVESFDAAIKQAGGYSALAQGGQSK